MSKKKPSGTTKGSAASGILFGAASRPQAAFGVAASAETAPQLLQRAMALHQHGDAAQAEALYRAVLRQFPDQPVALNFMGVLRIQLGQAAEAVTWLQRAVAARADFAEAHNNLGLAQRNAGQPQAAEHAFRQALQLRPAYPEALVNLANQLRDAGQPTAAVPLCSEALALRPDFAQAYNARAAALQACGQAAAALADAEQACQRAPGLASAHFNRALALGDLGRHADSASAYRAALHIQPQQPVAWNNLGLELDAANHPDEALGAYAQALARDPRYADAHINLANALNELHRHAEALQHVDAALQLQPANDGAWFTRGTLLAASKAFAAARDAFAQAHRLNPQRAYALGSAFGAALHACDWRDFDTQVAALEAGVAAGQPVCTPFEFLAVSDDPTLQRACASAYCAAVHPHAAAAPTARQQPAGDRVHVAYLSGDFHDHATAHLMADVFARHDHTRFKLSAWSYGPRTQDAMQTRLQAMFDAFHDVSRRADAEVANAMRAAGIDVLVDLKGYTAGSRSGILALRPAAVQVQYLGYPGTLGAPFVDAIVADAWVIPPGREADFSEHVLRLPHCYQPNQAEREVAAPTPTRATLGLPEHAVVLCCFNNNYKITPAVFAIWMRLLHQVPNSVLWLLQDTAEAAENLRMTAAAAGIDAQRLVFAERAALPQHLARHAAADLFLDTFPVNAHTTASDALYMALPLVTCSGRSFVSRVAGSLLHSLGLPELVCTDLAQYEATALRLAQDAAARTALRAHLLSARASSPLFQPTQMARDLEAAYLQALALGKPGALACKAAY